MRRSTSVPASLGIAGFLAFGGALADQPAWDCRMAPDGRSWQCLKDGQPHADPAPAESVDVTPAVEPQPAETTPAQPVPPPEPAAPEAAAVAAPPPAGEPAARPVEPAASWPAQAPKAPPPATAVKAAPQPQPPAAADGTPDEPAAPVSTPQAPAKPPSAEAQPSATAFPRADDLPDLTATPVPTPGTAASTAPAAPATAPVTAPAPAAVPTPTTGPGPQVSPAAADVPQPAPLTADIDQGIDWGSCGIADADRRMDFHKPAPAGERGPIEITADAAMTEFEPQRAVFSGNVLLTQDDVRLQAGSLALNRDTGEIEANQGFMFTQPDIRFAGSTGRYQTTTREAQVEQASYRVPAIRARGDADHAAYLGNGISRFDNISYTTCAPGDTSWILSADELELNQNEGFGTAKHASLSFLGVPLLYAPRFSFPIDDRRRSGVLVPSVGYSENTGADVSVPYYFNLAENYDLTLTPRVMSKRGLMLSSEFRFLTSNTHGTLATDLLPDDNERENGSSTRGAASLYTYSQFNPRTAGLLRVNYVSDSEYFEDLGGDLAATSATHLERTGAVTYHGDFWDLYGHVQYYQTIDDSIAAEDRPYKQLPLIRLDLEKPEAIGGVTYHLDAEYANFDRDDTVHGHRVALAPAVSLPLGNSWWFVEPKAGARYTVYDLTDQVGGRDDSPSHLTGMFSLDSGLYFDRETNYFGSTATHTLEPRAYYLYVPSSEQNDQPLFDTSELDFHFDNLFRENRFNGPDRVGDANQLTLALTSRVNDRSSGEELLRASIGQILYFEDRTVTLPGEPDLDDSTSTLVGELEARLGRGWRTRAGLQWDPHDGDDGTIDQALAQLSYRGDRRQVFNTSYRLRDGVANQTDLAFFWPLNEQLTLVGRHNYSLRDSRLLEGMAGIEYGTCCWRIRALARKYTDSSSDDHNLAFLLQLELHGLGQLGDDIDKTLERGIYGYRLDDDD